MSSISDVVLPVGLVLLGAYVVKRFMDNQQTPPTCSGDTSQTCLGPICWATCKQTGGSTGTQNAGQQAGTGTGTGGTGSTVSAGSILDTFCNFPGASIALPFCYPNAAKQLQAAI
jgi:hypothetical protein